MCLVFVLAVKVHFGAFLCLHELMCFQQIERVAVTWVENARLLRFELNALHKGVRVIHFCNCVV